MTQRVFDIENEKDMQDLWDILPDGVERIRKNDPNTEYSVYLYSDSSIFVCKVFKINWHDKTEINKLARIVAFIKFIQKNVNIVER